MNENSKNNQNMHANGEGNSSSLSNLRQSQNIEKAGDSKPNAQQLWRGGAPDVHTSPIDAGKPNQANIPAFNGNAQNVQSAQNGQMPSHSAPVDPNVADKLQKRNQTAQENRATLLKNRQLAAANAMKNQGNSKAGGLGAALGKVSPKMAALNAVMGLGKKKANPKEDLPEDEDGNQEVDSLGNEKSLKQKDKEDEIRNFKSGSFSVLIKRTMLLKLGLISIASGFLLFFIIIILSVIADNKGANIVMGDMASEDRSIVQDARKEMAGEVFDDEVGRGPGGDSYDEYRERFSLIGNVFSSENKCIGEDCAETPEFKYFLKMADIAYRYKMKYHVNLDWVLISATASYNEMTDEESMKAHYNSYNEDDVENLDTLMNLDWDYDYRNIPGYTYLDPNDYQYDIQIMAKNMVTKKTTQTCTKNDENGDPVIVKTQLDVDIEEQYFVEGQEHYLSCPDGTTYDRSSVYEVDKDKYDEFLLEYIEKKFYWDKSYVTYSGGQYNGDPVSADYISCNSDVTSANEELKKYVEENGGRGTREGVVAAAVWLTTKYPRVKYFWGGKYNREGVNPNWGCSKTVSDGGSSKTGTIQISGLDCSGFVSWAHINGGFNTKAGSSTQKTMGQYVAFNSSAYDISKVKPGDLLWMSGHIAMIIDVSETSITYAESHSGGTWIGTDINSMPPTGGNGFTGVVLMDAWYNNGSNKR